MSMGMRGLGWGGVLLLAGCGGRSGGASTSEVGTLGLQLRAEVNHVAYRLRDGSFEVTGPQSLSLNTEDDVDAAALEGTLAVGTYDIELLPGWRLEREFTSGFETLNAQLTSANPLPFGIEPGQRTSVRYEFFTDGARVGLGVGAFDVSIGVTDTSQTPGNPPVFDPAACDFAATTGCEELACDRACPSGLGAFCLDQCEAILTCVAQSPCSTEADPLCGAETRGQPSSCTNVVDSAGGIDAADASSPAFVARQFVECLCSVPRPGAGPRQCVEGQTEACDPSADLGSCRRGVRTCSNGVFSACQGAVFPAPRDCASAIDNDCDGLPDDTIDATCTCRIGSLQTCEAHPGRDGLGRCRAGQQLCLAGPGNATSEFGPCSGAVEPLPDDSCTIPGDDSNCDGIANGGCLSTPPCNGCFVSGSCVSAGSEQAGNPCLICDPARSTTSFVADEGKTCGAPATACSDQDRCDAEGLCQPNDLPANTACSSAAASACTQPDACDGHGNCEQRVAVNGTACEDGAFCTVGDVCQDGACVSGGLRDCGANQVCDEAAQQCQPSPPSFEHDLWPIFQAQCSPCHTTLRRGGHSVGSADLATAFADATRLGATLIDRLDGGGMPPACKGLPGDPGCISAANLAKIQLWIDTGKAP